MKVSTPIPSAHKSSGGGLRSSISRRGFLKAFALPAALPATAQTRSSAQPNILMILADDLGYGDLSSYGATDLKTPNIDALVGSGVRFDNFYANSPVCSPTRASLLSGRYPDRAGVPGVIRSSGADNWGFLDPSAILLPRTLIWNFELHVEFKPAPKTNSGIGLRARYEVQILEDFGKACEHPR